MQEVDRTRRVAELMKRELATLISHDLNDNRINSVTLTSVTVSRDLKQSTAYFSSIQTEQDPKVLEKLLNKSASFLRFRLSKVLEIRTTPALTFKYDSSLKRGMEMSTLIEKLNKGNE